MDAGEAGAERIDVGCGGGHLGIQRGVDPAGSDCIAPDTLGPVIDRDGAIMDCEHNRRCISADLDTVRQIPKRLMVVQEAEKFEALKAALRGGFVSHLVVTRSMGEQLMDAWKA